MPVGWPSFCWEDRRQSQGNPTAAQAAALKQHGAFPASPGVCSAGSQSTEVAEGRPTFRHKQGLSSWMADLA